MPGANYYVGVFSTYCACNVSKRSVFFVLLGATCTFSAWIRFRLPAVPGGQFLLPVFGSTGLYRIFNSAAINTFYYMKCRSIPRRVPTRWVLEFCIPAEEMETQRGSATCSGSHSSPMAEPVPRSQVQSIPIAGCLPRGGCWYSGLGFTTQRIFDWEASWTERWGASPLPTMKLSCCSNFGPNLVLGLS